MYPLSQEDRNLLTDKKEEVLEQNDLLNNANASAEVEIAKRLRQDVAFKKQTDDPHFRIAMFEEELKRLDGTSIPQPLQEQGFIITDTISDARLYVNEGRFKITENNQTVVDVPIIPFRGYSLSQPCGKDFDIWSRDRFGSSTSMPTVVNFNMNTSNSRFRVKINNEEQTVDFSSLIALPDAPAYTVYDGGSLAATYQGIFRDIEINSTISTVSEPYSIIEGDKISISVDGGVPQEVEFTSLTNTSIQTTNSEMFAMQDLDEISVSIDGNTPQIAKFLTTKHAFCQNSTTQYYLYDTSTMFLSLDGGTNQVATFLKADFADLTQATAAEVAVVLNRDWTGVTASVTTDLTLKIEHNTAGGFFQIIDGYLKPNLVIDLPIDPVKVDPLMNMTAQEVCDNLNSYWIGITAAPFMGNVILTVSPGLHNMVFADIVGSPLSELGLPETYGFLTAQDIVDTLSAGWTGVKVEVNDINVMVTLDGTDKFQIMDGNGNPNQVIGFSEHLILKTGTSGFENCGISYDSSLSLFTIASGMAGPDSTVEVLSTTNDIATDMGFLPNQYLITGKYANNLLNVEIDGTAAEILIGDFRKCDIDADRGEVNDDYSFLWSGVGKSLGYIGTTRVGPLFCYQGDNGKAVARSIQSQLRAVGTGGFKDAVCAWYSDDQTFIVYSGTFGVDSSVHILEASDLLRDARATLGYITPADEKGHEIYYDTLGSLEYFINNNIDQHAEITGVTDVNRKSHSILYFRGVGLEGVKIYEGWQTFIVPTTKIYDDGSRGWPRLYPNGYLTIDDTNDVISFCETTNRELIAYVEHGVLTAGDIAAVVQEALNAYKEINTYTVSYSSRTNKFTINSSGFFQLLWKTGRYSVRSIGNQLGYDVTVDTGFSTSHVSGTVIYTNSDYFNPVFCSQFYGLPKADDTTVEEQFAIIKEEDLLKSEQNDSSLLDWIKNATEYDNEFSIESWEWLQALELAKVQQEYNSLLIQVGSYSNHISEMDTEITTKINAINNLMPNKNSLEALSSHGSIIDLTIGDETYSVTSGGQESLDLTLIPITSLVYNKPSPLVAYTSLPLKHIPGEFTPYSLYSNAVSFTPRPMPAFSITNFMQGTAGYSFSIANLLGSFTIPPPTPATDICTNTETYDMSGGNDTLKMKINNGVEKTATFDATAGYTESRIATISGFVIETGTNDLIQIDEGNVAGFTDSLTQTYILTGDAAAFTDSVVQNYNLTNGDQLRISVNGGGVQTATFNTADFVNINAATAAEIVVVLTTDWTGVTASVVGGKVRITHNTVGASNTFQISDGTGNPNVQLGFSTTLKSGTNPDQINISINGGAIQTATFNTSDFANINAATAAEIVTVLTSDWIGVTASVVSNKVRITRTLAGLANTFQISDGAGNPNVQLGFTTALVAGIDGIKNVTLTAGAYTGISLATQIQTKLDSVGLSNYTVDYNSTASNRFTIVSDGAGGTGIFSLLWVNSTADYILGFNNTNDTGSLSYTSDNQVVYAVQTNVNDRFTVRINGILSAGNITITQGLYTTAALLATEMATQIAADANFVPSDFTVVYTASKFRVTSSRRGTTSTVAIYESSGRDFLQTVALDGDVPVQTGSDVGDISKVTATEVVNILIAEIGSSITAEVETGAVRITTISTGSRAKIEITGGTARTVLGFDLNDPVYGKDAQNLLKVNIDGDTTQAPIILSTGTILASTLAVEIQNKLRLIPSGGYADAICTWNETARWQTFTNQLRIESGVRGVGSSVEVVDGVVKINNTNNKIDFTHLSINPTIVTATLINGSYSPDALATEVQNQLNATSSMTFSVSYNISTGRMDFSGDDRFILFWLAGPNQANSAYYVLGFNKADTSLGFTVSGEYEVLDQNAWEILGFDLQTLEPGHDLTSVLLTITDLVFSTKLYWTDNGGGNRQDLNINITTNPNNTITGLVATLNADLYYGCDYGGAYLQSRVSEKYRLENNDTLIVSANGSSDQTFTFLINYGQSESGEKPQTRVYSNVNDRIRLAVNGLATENTVTNELEVVSATPGQTTFNIMHNTVKAGSSSGVITRTYPSPSIIPITETTDYVLSTNGTVVMNTGLMFGDQVRMDYKWYSGLYEIILGTQMTPEDIASKIQQEVREIVNGVPETRAALLGFTCVYNGKYILKLGTGGTSSSLMVLDGSINSAAASLKLGISYGGIETTGAGSFCVNSGYITTAELITFINATATDFIAEGTNYLVLKSTEVDASCRITVNESSTALAKLGFDNNFDLFPLEEVVGITSVMLLNVTDQEIISVAPPVLTFFEVNYGWRTDKGDVVLTYYWIDKLQIEPRKTIISDRLLTILPRKNEIISRVNDIVAALTPVLYQERIDAVRIRLNKRTGSYVRVGDKYNEIDNNNTMIAANTAYANEIDGMLI